jgi:hypothetical protein
MYWVKVPRKLSMTPVPPMMTYCLRESGAAAGVAAALGAGR